MDSYKAEEKVALLRQETLTLLHRMKGPKVEAELIVADADYLAKDVSTLQQIDIWAETLAKITVLYEADKVLYEEESLFDCDMIAIEDVIAQHVYVVTTPEDWYITSSLEEQEECLILTAYEQKVKPTAYINGKMKPYHFVFTDATICDFPNDASSLESVEIYWETVKPYEIRYSIKGGIRRIRLHSLQQAASQLALVLGEALSRTGKFPSTFCIVDCFTKKALPLKIEGDLIDMTSQKTVWFRNLKISRCKEGEY